MTTRDLILAVDGGGSASRCAIYDAAGHEAASFTIASLSCKASSFDAVEQTLSDMMDKLTDYLAALSACVLGLSGLDSPDDVQTMARLLSRCGLCDARTASTCTPREVPYGWLLEGEPSVLLASDALLPLFSMGARAGTVLIAGTGSVALHIDASGNIRRYGGWGYQVSDEGSGCWVGAEFLRAALHVADLVRSQNSHKHEDATDQKLLVEAFLATHPHRTQTSAFDMAEAICAWASEHTHAKDLAALARPALESETRSSTDIRERAAEKLAFLAGCAIERADEPVVLAGGVFENERFFEEARMAIATNTSASAEQIVRPTQPATWGAFMLAKHAGYVPAS